MKHAAVFACGIWLLTGGIALAGPKRVLYVTHSAGFVHGSIPLSQTMLSAAAARTGLLEVTVTEDLSLLTADSLRDYDALFFFTSGELPISDSQKADLLEFARSGKGFGGVHSATDTLYTWPEYGDLIGAYFNGHPWAQEAGVIVEDRDHFVTRGLEAQFRISDEFYQFRDFSRERVHVLIRLDTSTVDLNAPGVARDDGDFALAWVRDYGNGRVFYCSLGHSDETWRDERYLRLLTNALLLLTGQEGASVADQ